MVICKWWHCAKEVKGKDFCSKSCGNKFRVDRRRREVKYRLVLLKGGKCEKCGYDKAIEALEFHHRNKEDKSFALSSGNTPSYEVLLSEVSKCDLLCSNCHRELEAEIYKDRWEEIRRRVADDVRTHRGPHLLNPVSERVVAKKKRHKQKGLSFIKDSR